MNINDAAMVFVGFGINAPRYGWNDYKVNVSGKVVVCLVNEPLADSSIFLGDTLTYHNTTRTTIFFDSKNILRTLDLQI